MSEDNVVKVVWELNVLDIVAVVVAVASIWFAIVESWRNNNVSVKVIEAATSMRTAYAVNGGQPFMEFHCVIRNRGIPLHGIRASLEFTGPHLDSGWWTMSIPASDNHTPQGELSRGMIATFVLRSFEMPEESQATLLQLTSCWQQKAVIRLYAQNYLAWTLRIGGLNETMQDWCNALRRRINWLTLRKVGKSRQGHDVCQYRVRVPLYVTVGVPVMQFRNGIREIGG